MTVEESNFFKRYFDRHRGYYVIFSGLGFSLLRKVHATHDHIKVGNAAKITVFKVEWYPIYGPES